MTSICCSHGSDGRAFSVESSLLPKFPPLFINDDAQKSAVYKEDTASTIEARAYAITADAAKSVIALHSNGVGGWAGWKCA